MSRVRRPTPTMSAIDDALLQLDALANQKRVHPRRVRSALGNLTALWELHRAEVLGRREEADQIKRYYSGELHHAHPHA